MADDKQPLISSSGIKQTAIIEPLMLWQELGELQRDIILLRGEVSFFARQREEDEEIDTASLVESDQSVKRHMSTINDRSSLLTQMLSAICAEARAEAVRARGEFYEMHSDARREDALRRGIIPFAGGSGSHSVLSILAGAHSIGQGIFSFLTMKDSNNVRPVCVEFRQAIMDFPWMDKESKIKSGVKAWRKAFPYARAVNVSWRQDIVDADFVHIRGDARVRLHTVEMWSCRSVTDAAFMYLRGIHALNMSNCTQATITDAAFVHLRGIHTLKMWGCNQASITDAAFVHLRGIHTLDMSGCTQASITDAAFVNLRGIYKLTMSCCNQATITDAAFVHLQGIHALDMCDCTQPTITDAALVHLVGIKRLETYGCSRDVRIAAAQVMGINYESEPDEDENEDEDDDDDDE